jgi:serine/threonine-protein kinase RsbW
MSDQRTVTERRNVNGEEVRLAVPALPEYVRLARLTAAGLASRLGFSFDEVEDLRIAVDELCYLLVGPDGRDGTITLRFAMDGSGLRVVGEGREDPSVGSEFAELSEQILAAIVDDYQVTRDGGTVTFRMTRNRQAV